MRVGRRAVGVYGGDRGDVVHLGVEEDVVNVGRGATLESSPAVYCWDSGRSSKSSPVGTVDRRACSFVPTGTCN